MVLKSDSEWGDWVDVCREPGGDVQDDHGGAPRSVRGAAADLHVPSDLRDHAVPAPDRKGLHK